MNLFWIILGLIFWGMIWVGSDYIYDKAMALIERRKRAHRRPTQHKIGKR